MLCVTQFECPPDYVLSKSGLLECENIFNFKGDHIKSAGCMNLFLVLSKGFLRILKVIRKILRCN